MKHLFFLLCFLTTSYAIPLPAQTIAEKKALIQGGESDFDRETSKSLEDLNQDLKHSRKQLQQLHQYALKLHEKGASESDFQKLIKQILQIRNVIKEKESSWKENIISKSRNEDYSLWNLPDTTLGQLIMDYGAEDFVYLIPPEIGELRLSINSSLPIPKEAWGEMLDHILSANGVGVKKLTPFLKELFLAEERTSGLQLVTDNPNDLTLLPPSSRLCYVLSPKNLEPKEAFKLLDRFSTTDQTSFHMLGRQILVITQVENLKELLKVYHFVETHREEKEYKIFTLKKIDAAEMEKVLLTMFYGSQENSPFNFTDREPEEPSGSSLRTFALKSHGKSLFIMGTKDEVIKAAEIIRDIESQVAEAHEKEIYTYACQYSEAKEIVKALRKVYPLLIKTPKGSSGATEEFQDPDNFINNYFPTASFDDPTIDNHHKGDPFIVDEKTGSIIMVIEKPLIPKIRQLLKKIDIPKTMVRIEILLVEKRIKDSNSFGLNLLKMGNQASNLHTSGLAWNNITSADTSNTGVLSFLFSRKKTSTGIPAYDLAYRLLLSQNDVQVNANPSVTTVNQTAATIEIVDEISINTGTVLQTDSNNDGLFTDAYTRAEYGIIIEVTPTVHLHNDNNSFSEEGHSVTLSTNIRFDSQSPSTNNRPDVTKRMIKNEVRIPDGQTVIIGGLRRKDFTDNSNKVPFLGELPGIGKLFGTTDMSDSKTEMFVFLTPKIIIDPSHDFIHNRIQEMKRRPGDIPEFMLALEEARLEEKRQLFDGTLKMLFGRYEKPTTFSGEYDGR